MWRLAAIAVAASVHQAAGQVCSPEVECGSEESSLAVLLLQADLRLRAAGAADRLRPDAPAVSYRPDLLWSPSPEADILQRGPAGCELSARNDLIARAAPTAFVRGECPEVLQAPRRPVRLQLDVERDGTNATGYNPSLVALPDRLKQHFPTGRWLAALRAGDEHYPMSVCQHPGIAVSKALKAGLPSTALMWGTARRLHWWVKKAIQEQDKTFRYGPKTYVVVLDDAYRVLVQTPVTMRNGEGPWDDSAIQDLRLAVLGNGDLLVGFQAYYLSMAGPALSSDFDWRMQECVAKLHVQTSSSGLQAWVDRKETRVVHDCPEKGLVAPGPKKNFGFIQTYTNLYLLDWVYPTKVGELDMASLAASRANNSEHITSLCFGYGPTPPNLVRSPWDKLQSLPLIGDDTEPVGLHNGTPLVWIDEIGAWLGVGHLLRHFTRKRLSFGLNAMYYTQQFYTITGGPESGRPFALDQVSNEFCFDSAQTPGSCESIQVATSLVRDGDQLQIGYGVMDCESYIVTVSLDEVLHRLKPVQ